MTRYNKEKKALNNVFGSKSLRHTNCGVNPVDDEGGLILSPHNPQWSWRR